LAKRLQANNPLSLLSFSFFSLERKERNKEKFKADPNLTRSAAPTRLLLHYAFVYFLTDCVMLNIHLRSGCLAGALRKFYPALTAESSSQQMI